MIQFFNIACDLCGSTQVDFVFSESNSSGTYSSYHCRSCNLHQTLGDVDPVSPDYIHLRAEDLDEQHVFTQRGHKLTAFRQWQRVIAAEGMKSLEGLKLLDIGCGVGGFLEYAESLGLDCYGFDASPAQVEQARKKFPNVRRAESVADYCAQLGKEDNFDLITMWDVFEHIRTPASLLAELNGHLSPLGFFYVSVPSGALNKAKSQLAKAFGKTKIGLIPWEHVFYYTPKSLRIRLENAGMEVKQVGGVVPYQRMSLTGHEVLRRAVHHVLRTTPRALQIYGLAMRRRAEPE